MTFGGFEIAMMAGAMRGAAARGVLLLVDGVITSAAYRVALNDYAVFCRCSDEHGHRALLRYLDAKPLLHLGLRLGEGSGAALVAGVLRTGAFHEDGLANFYDGVYGGLSIARRLEIMKDSRVGTYGVLALLSVLGLKFAALASLPPAYLPLILIAGHALSRAFAVSFIYRHACVRSDGGKVQVMAESLSLPELLFVRASGLLPLLWLSPELLWALLALVVLRIWLARTLTRQLAGYTGDALARHNS